MQDSDPVSPTLGAWKGVQAMYADYQRSPSGGSKETGKGSAGGAIFARVTAVTGGGSVVSATEVRSGTWADFSGARSFTEVTVIGPPLKTGLFVRLEPIATASSYKWIAHGYPWRMLDWGVSGNEAPFVFENGMMKVKTWKTDNGIFWEQEKIDLSDEEC